MAAVDLGAAAVALGAAAAVVLGELALLEAPLGAAAVALGALVPPKMQAASPAAQSSPPASTRLERQCTTRPSELSSPHQLALQEPAPLLAPPRPPSLRFSLQLLVSPVP